MSPSDNTVSLYLANKRFRRNLRSKKKRKIRRWVKNHQLKLAAESLGDDKSINNIYDKWMPPNLRYLLFSTDSDFSYERIISDLPAPTGVYQVPKVFSIVDNPKESYAFIQNVIGELMLQRVSKVEIDYAKCIQLDLGAQVLFDVLLMDVFKFYQRCRRYKKSRPKVNTVRGINVRDLNVRKLLFSVGSPVIHDNRAVMFSDIEPYRLCTHDSMVNGDPVRIREQKDLDTTKLVDYVLACLERLGRTLTEDRLDDLSTVIGEILINAEEHSTTRQRFSIGYFHEVNDDGHHHGVFRLVIMNFGMTIYEKFKDPEIPNKSIADKMKKLSEQYTKRKFFQLKAFEEETLWTLYALQEGVSSVSPDQYLKRGNGSIQFIESFFNIKGKFKESDDTSKMVILSGRTEIVFDGTYNIIEKTDGVDTFKYMTFNKTGSLDEKPDSRFVKYRSEYFPGTIISAKILFNEDDLALRP